MEKIEFLASYPGLSEAVRFLSEEISKDTYTNMMEQYRPCFKTFGAPPPNRAITSGEYEEAIKMALGAGLGRIAGVNSV